GEGQGVRLAGRVCGRSSRRIETRSLVVFNTLHWVPLLNLPPVPHKRLMAAAIPLQANAPLLGGAVLPIVTLLLGLFNLTSLLGIL
ncbi:MAG: hypothetical protein QMD10_11585, partial [Desulfitobacteriaceae bacterium]|nr:hypothetical protein [Desulfitobacteriaceae bacterium]